MVIIAPERLRPNTTDWFLSPAERCDATAPVTTFEERMMQVFRGLCLRDQMAVLAGALARSVHPRNAIR